MNCALLNQVNDVDMDHRRKSSSSSTETGKGLKSDDHTQPHNSALIRAYSFLTSLVIPVSFNEVKNRFQQKRQRIKMH